MKTEEFVLQLAGSGDHDYIEVRLTDGGYSSSSYMNGVAHYDTLKLARLAVDTFHCRYKSPVKIIRIVLEEVETVDKEEKCES